jgi:hypothetical protein
MMKACTLNEKKSSTSTESSVFAEKFKMDRVKLLPDVSEETEENSFKLVDATSQQMCFCSLNNLLPKLEEWHCLEHFSPC